MAGFQAPLTGRFWAPPVIAEPLMGPLSMIIVQPTREDMPQVRLAKDDEPVEALELKILNDDPIFIDVRLAGYACCSPNLALIGTLRVSTNIDG